MLAKKILSKIEQENNPFENYQKNLSGATSNEPTHHELSKDTSSLKF